MIHALKNHPEKGRLFISTGIILFFVFVAIAAPILSPHTDPANPDILKLVGRLTDKIPHPPSEGVYLGTLPGQYDIFHILVWGTRSALSFGITVTFFSALIGILLGVISGYSKGWISRFILQVTEIFMGFPVIVGIMFIKVYFLSLVTSGTQISILLRALLNLRISPMMLALILFSWMSYVKLIHTSFSQQIHQEYIQSAITIGATPLRVIFRHILPNAFSPAAVLAAKSVGGMVILEAGLAFIGISRETDWGYLLVLSRDWIMSGLKFWWMFVPVSLAIFIFSIGWNMLGDQITILFNPKLKSYSKNRMLL